jgi:SAM-dependent methyltransferase
MAGIDFFGSKGSNGTNEIVLLLEGEQVRDGDWQGLNCPTQKPRYEAIAEIVKKRGAASVLDVGCGEAVLANYLPEWVEYNGLESSSEALRKVDNLVHVVLCAAESYLNRREWDAIIFNESLYYCADPRSLLNKYAAMLKRGGVLIVSIYQRPENMWATRLRRLLGNRVMTNRTCTLIVEDWMRGRLVQQCAVRIPSTDRVWKIWVGRR